MHYLRKAVLGSSSFLQDECIFCPVWLFFSFLLFRVSLFSCPRYAVFCDYDISPLPWFIYDLRMILQLSNDLSISKST